MDARKLYIGLMSGTSMDGVDAVLLAIEESTNAYDVIAHHSQPIPVELGEALYLLCNPGADDVSRLGRADVAIGKLFAQTVLDLLSAQNLSSDEITAIGSHGQTIRHCPPSVTRDNPFTIQIGDPSTIAALTGITTVADFRRKDMALGGEAAPLVPAFHQAVFQSETLNRAIVNIGGIANITWLPARATEEPVTGFDTGPGNCLMDGWVGRHQQQPFDNRGEWAASGKPWPALMARLLDEPYLTQPAPKSTGRELFNQHWLDQILDKFPQVERPETIQATLCEFTATTIARGLSMISARKEIDEIYLCGGGVFNDQLVGLLKRAVPGTLIQTTASQGIHPLQVEAAAFAWLAHRTLNNLPGNIAEVTGASRPAVLGGVYLP